MLRFDEGRAVSLSRSRRAKRYESAEGRFFVVAKGETGVKGREGRIKGESGSDGVEGLEQDGASQV